MVGRDSLFQFLVAASRKALDALVDEVDHYASVNDAPESTLTAIHELRLVLEKCDANCHKEQPLGLI